MIILSASPVLTLVHCDLLTSSHPQISASHLLGLQDLQQTPASLLTLNIYGWSQGLDKKCNERPCWWLCGIYSVKDSLSNGQQQTGSNAGLEVNCITLIDQTPTLTARLSGPSCWHNTWAVPRPAWMRNVTRGPADDYDSPNIENFPDFWTGRDVR